MQALDAGIYATALSITHARISLPHAINSVVYGRNPENEPVSRIKMADNRALGTL